MTSIFFKVISIIACLTGVHLIYHFVPLKVATCHSTRNFYHRIQLLSKGTAINSLTTHKDLGILINNNLKWSLHQDNVLTKGYKTLDLIRRTFSNSISSTVKCKLYITLVRSLLMYCSPIWHPHLMKDIIKLEQLQRTATKHILQDYSSDCKSRLTNLNLLPLCFRNIRHNVFYQQY